MAEDERSQICLCYRFTCDVCGLTFLNRSNFDNHVATHNPQRRCDQCGKLLPGKRDLDIHLAREHSLAELAHACSVCGKGFAAQQKLDQHLRSHTGERPYPCTECDKKFARKDKLLEHFRLGEFDMFSVTWIRIRSMCDILTLIRIEDAHYTFIQKKN